MGSSSVKLFGLVTSIFMFGCGTEPEGPRLIGQWSTATMTLDASERDARLIDGCVGVVAGEPIRADGGGHFLLNASVFFSGPPARLEGYLEGWVRGPEQVD